MARRVKIVYHSPSVARPDRWAGERARQLVEALGRIGGDVRALPAVESDLPSARKGSGGRVRGWIRSRVPPAWRGTIIRLGLLQRGTANTVKWSWRLWRRLRSEPPDVLLARYHEHEWTPLVISRLLRRPLVLEVHSPFALEGTVRGERPSRLAGWMDRTFFRRSDLL